MPDGILAGETKDCKSMLQGNVFITGGAGTLGRAIIRKAEAEDWPCQFTVYSRSEFLQAQMRSLFPKVRYVLGDVRDQERLSAGVAGHNIVIHAAAMKRIPECEQHPTECYQTNIIGSANVVKACLENNVDSCVGISTDKACRATTMYGASKLALEKLFQGASHGNTNFTLVRYGNVVASRGSVIPIWRKQAKEGKPLTVTDFQMTRFWMAESDAVDLVLAAYGASFGTITVPRMKALPIVDMARIIAPHSDMKEIGLRSIEKRHEDLVHEEEGVIKTDTHYIIQPHGGEMGHRYTSEIAPRLTSAEFLAMLAEAEAHE